MKTPEHVSVNQRIDDFRTALLGGDSKKAKNLWMGTHPQDHAAYARSPVIDSDLLLMVEVLGVQTISMMSQLGLTFQGRATLAKEVFEKTQTTGVGWTEAVVNGGKAMWDSFVAHINLTGMLATLNDAKRVKLWRSFAELPRKYYSSQLKVSAFNPHVLQTLFDATPRGEIEVLKNLLRVRFGVTFRPSTKAGETPAAWDEPALRRIWRIMAALPKHHVEGNSVFDFMERRKSDDGISGVFNRREKRVGIGYTNMTDKQKSQRGDPLHGVNRFDKVVRHEIGHAVDRANGLSNSYCIGNPAGGNWNKERRSRIAATLVNASAGAISRSPHRAAIVAALQRVVNARNPGDIDKAINGVAGLSKADRRAAKSDLAVKALRVAFKKGSGPWYRFPDTGGVAIGGRIYQESKRRKWWSYDQSARTRKVSTYQFRAPGEWFAEAYAAYYEPSAVLGDKLAARDPATKRYFDKFVHRQAGDHQPPDPESGNGVA